MKIRNQDGDRSYNVSKVYYKGHSFQHIFMGWNIYGVSESGRKYLLGTRDTDLEASQIVKEIQTLMSKGVDKYSIPSVIEDYEAEAIIEELEAKLR